MTRPLLNPDPTPRPRVTWTFCGGVFVAAFAAGGKPVVLLDAPATRVSRLPAETARELAEALRSAAKIAEYFAAPAAASQEVPS